MSPYFLENMDFYIFHFGVKMELYVIRGNDMAHLEKYSRSQLGHILNDSGRERPSNII